MISFTVENVFILAVFQLLVSGLILCGTGAVLSLQRESVVRKISILVGIAFSFYSLHLLLKASLYYHNLDLLAPTALPVRWDLLGHALETLALVSLGLAYLPHLVSARPRDWWPWSLLAAALVFVVVSPHAAHEHWPGRVTGSILGPAVNGVFLIAVGALHLRRKGRKALFSVAPLPILSAAQFFEAAARAPRSPEWLWAAGQAGMLLGLGLFALVVDARSRNLQVRFFLRLNLTFVALAGLLILIVTETERREYLRFAETHAEELAEFLRGHVIYLHSRGRQPAEILSSPEIIHKVTSDLGRPNDLHRVRVHFRGWQMEMALASDWTVSHEVFPEGSRLPPAREDERGRVSTLAPVFVVSGGETLGRIEFDQGLRSINLQVARQMRIIFITFTIAVFGAAALFGFTAHQANRTIQGQFAELERTHAQLAHAARLSSVGQLAGGVAHEINNPAGIILTTSDYLLRESANSGLPESVREDLEAIRRQARRISNVVNELLTFSRPTVLNKRVTDMNAVLQESLGLVSPRFRNQHVEVAHQLAPDLPRITADPGRLEQVFVNLLNNAADAMPHGGKLTVETAAGRRNGRKELVVTIRDTGVGIPEHHLKSIFDPFFTTKSKGEGTGLGLSITYGIARDHGGQIEVESQVDHGSVFRVRLPADAVSHGEL